MVCGFIDLVIVDVIVMNVVIFTMVIITVFTPACKLKFGCNKINNE